MLLQVTLDVQWLKALGHLKVTQVKYIVIMKSSFLAVLQWLVIQILKLKKNKDVRLTFVALPAPNRNVKP